MGKIVQVKNTSSGKHFLKATINKESDVRSPGLVEPLPKGAISGVKADCVTSSNAISTVTTTPMWIKIGIFILFVAVVLDIAKVGWSWSQS